MDLRYISDGQFNTWANGTRNKFIDNLGLRQQAEFTRWRDVVVQ